MKVYIHLENNFKDFTLKVNVKEGMTVGQILDHFILAYNKQVEPSRPILAASSTSLSMDGKTSLDTAAKASTTFKNGDDIYATIDSTASTVERVCKRNGCSKAYTDATNTFDSCRFHPKAPIFHEGLKGWGCCSKRVDNFDDFMSLPGCSYGHHSDYVESEIKKEVETNSDIVLEKNENGVSTYTSNAPLKREQVVHRYGEKINVKDYIIEEPDDPLDAVIAMGTKCRHNGCNSTFEGDHSRTEPCKYHPGQAIFHESSKYWSCCKPRCAEFEEFLKIEGCKVGRHKFLPKPGDIQDDNFVKCRYDHYQYGDFVIVSVYAKKTDKEKTTVKIEEREIHVFVSFEDGKRFEKTIPLYDAIDPNASKFSISNTMVEINLKKKDPSDWPSLEPRE